MAPKLVIEVVGDTSGLDKSFRKVDRSAKDLNRSLGQVGRGAVAGSLAFKGLGRSVAFASTAFLGGAGLVAGIKASVSAASNLAEQTAKTNVVFGESANTVKAWSKTTVGALGLAEDQALETASSFGALLRPLGLTGSEAAKQSTRLTKLGADLASFYNTSVSDALTAVRSGLIGEAEPLRRYGVLLTEARVQAEAMAQTGKTVAGSLTAQEKVLARQAIIFRDSAQAQDDFARTSGGLANQQRILSANIRQLQIGIGNALIPDVLRVTSAMNDWLSKSENQKRVTDAVRAAVGALRGVVEGLTPVVRGVAQATQTFSDAVGGAGNAVKILGAALVGLKFRGAIAGLTAIQTSATGAAFAAGTLRTRLLSLAKIGAITIPLVLAIENKKEIESFLDRNHLGFLTMGLGESLDAALPPLQTPFGTFFDGPRKIKGAGPRPSPDTLDPFVPKKTVFGGSTGRGSAGALDFGLGTLSPAERNALALAAAGRTPSTADDLAALADQREILGRQIAQTQRKLAGSRGEKASDLAKTLAALFDDDASAFSQIQSINAAAASDAKSKGKAIKKATVDRGKAVQDAVKAIVDGRKLGVAGGLTLAQVRAATTKGDNAAAQAAQFRGLGLTSQGEEFAPSPKVLLAQTNKLQASLKGTLLDTSANSNQLGKIRATIKKHGNELTRETRLWIKQFEDALTGSLGDKTGAETKFRTTNVRKILEAAGLSPAAVKRASLALSQRGAGGTVPGAGSGAFGRPIEVVIHHTTVLDGKPIEKSVTRRQQKRNSRNPQQKRGPFQAR